MALLPNLVNAQELIDREALNEKAGEEFLSTHFFENGRGMTISPDLSIFFGGLKKNSSSLLVDSIISKRYGFNEGKKQRYVGVFEVQYKGMDLAVLGCTGCHSGKAAGIIIPGLGNKTIDPYLIGKDLLKTQGIWQNFIQDKISEDKDYAYVHEKAMNFAKVLANDDISNLTRGLVPDSTIKTFFYKDQGVPWGPEIERTQVKVPSLWGFKEKREVGVFADGSLNSNTYAWAFGAELFASDSGDHLRASLPKLKHVVDNVLGNLLPPKFPFEIDQELALKGKPLVENTCFRCHGQHKRDPEGFPIYEAPKLIPHHMVETDEQRLDYGNSIWVDLAEQGSVKDLIQFNHDFFGYGFFAPKLWGIWSRFPYLHNGSVPSLYHLLVPPEERPVVFDMEDAGEAYRFNKSIVGLTIYHNPVMINIKTHEAQDGDRNLYYTERPEHSNKGHYFSFMDEYTEDDRMAIIEYLKTL
jgi:hypothetical protein